MRICLLTRSYPSDGDLYQYPFVHRRVLAYVAAGHTVKVLRLAEFEDHHIFDGITCHTVMPGHFAGVVSAFGPDVISVHGLDEEIWTSIATLNSRWPICAWLHGSEIPAFFREKAQRMSNEDDRLVALEAVERRVEFWCSVLREWPQILNLAFVSRSSVELMRQDLGDHLPETGQIVVIHNPIDTDLFTFSPKVAEDRYRILSIRPYDSSTYGNDLAVAAVLALQSHSAFDRMQFTFIGDGPLFETVLAPIRGLPNVSIQRRFLRQEEIASMHRQHGVFLVPTRLDTQGVSRDEAMASGLVPVTNSVYSIPEFADDSCAGLADPEDVHGLASQIAAMMEDPSLFLSRSSRAARKVREQTGHRIIIPQELEWMGRCSGAAL